MQVLAHRLGRENSSMLANVRVPSVNEWTSIHTRGEGGAILMRMGQGGSVCLVVRTASRSLAAYCCSTATHSLDDGPWLQLTLWKRRFSS